MDTIFRVYWASPDNGHACSQDFTDMTEALRQTQMLRDIGRRFVTMCSEQADMVGEYGVRETGPDYDWRKRRP